MSDKRRLTTDELLARYPHYYKDVRHLEVVDIYRVLELFGVTDPTVQHAVKKLMVPGKRGGKGVAKDLDEALDTLERGAIMREEDLLRGKISPKPTVVVTNTVSAIPQLTAEQVERMLNEPAPSVPVRDINACVAQECNARREVGSCWCLAHTPPPPKPWSRDDYPNVPDVPQAPPPPPAAPVLRCEVAPQMPIEDAPASTVWQQQPAPPPPAVIHKPGCTEKVSAIVCPCNNNPVPSLPVPVPSLPTPQLPVDGLALAVHNNVNASSPSPLPRC